MQVLKVVLIVFLTLNIVSCVGSIKTGQEKVFRAIAERNVDKLGKLAIDHGNDDIRISAVKGLRVFENNPKATSYIIAVITNTYNPIIRLEAVKSLSYQLDLDEARVLLTDYLYNGDVTEKMPIIENIYMAKRVNSESKIQFLRIPLGDSSPDVRLAAAINLRKLGDLSGSEVVNELSLSNFLPIKRRAAAEMIHHVDERFYDSYQYLAENETDRIVKGYAVLALKKIPERTALRRTPRVEDRNIAKDIIALHTSVDDDLAQTLRSKTPQVIDRTKYLIAIGIENYTDLPDVKYAKRSTELIVDSFQKILGIHTSNTLMLVNDDATGSRIINKVDKFIQKLSRDSVVYFYYAGHGAPSDNGIYMLPKDACMDDYKNKYFELNAFIQKIRNKEPQHVYAFVDSCFSGRISPNKLLFDGVAPLVLVSQVMSDKDNTGFTLITASKKDQFANAYDVKHHRLFSYYLAKSVIDGDRSSQRIYEKIKGSISSCSREKGKSYRQDIDGYGLLNDVL